jgi:hypothetical protein
VWTVVVAAVSVGAYNSVTAASGKIEIAPGSSSMTVSLGTQLNIVFWVGGEKANDLFPPEIWEFSGTLPAGIVGIENTNAGTFSFTGIATEAGQFPITVKAWEKLNKNEGSNDTFEFTIIVEGPGITFTEHPVSKTVPWGDFLLLTAATDLTEGTTYQWQRILVGEVDYSDINGETGTSLSIATMTSADKGMYRLVATNAGNSTPSNSANIEVTTTPFQLWREMNFQDPFSAIAAMDQDPDNDTLVNSVEFTFGRDPNKAESIPLVHTSREVISNTSYTIFTFPPILAGVDSTVSFEGNEGLDSDTWISLQNGALGVIIESADTGYAIKLPDSGLAFTRVRIVTN